MWPLSFSYGQQARIYFTEEGFLFAHSFKLSVTARPMRDSHLYKTHSQFYCTTKLGVDGSFV
jgi:hypothetical protein